MLGRSFRLVLHYSAETKAEPRAARSEGAGDPGMRRIVEKHGADSNAADPVRVLRVPGFYHCKGKRALVRLTKCGGRRYTTAELVKAFPPIKRARPNRSRVATSDTVDQGALQSALEHLAATQHPHSRHSEGTYVALRHVGALRVSHQARTGRRRVRDMGRVESVQRQVSRRGKQSCEVGCLGR